MKLSNINDIEDFILQYNWYESRSRNQEEEIALLRTCEAFALQHNHKKLLYRTRAYITNYYTQVNDLKLAIEIGIENYESCKAENFTDELLMMLSFLIQIYQILGNYSQAEIYINICKEYAYELEDTKKLCNIHILSANQFFYTGDTSKCIKEYELALQYAHKLNDSNTLITIYNNYAYQIAASDFTKAEEILNKGMQLIQEQIENNSNIDYLLGHYYLNYAQLYEQQQRINEAINYSKKAITLFHKYNVVDSSLEAELILSGSYLKLQQYDWCLQHLKNIEQTAVASASNSILLKCYKIFHDFYEQQADYKEAHSYLRKYVEVKDLTYNQESEKTIRNLQISHEVKTIKLEKENAERIGKLKHDFLANMSHEIRTPINSIIGICYLLQQDNLSNKQQNYIERLERSGENLLGIINDILDISKIEAGKFELVLVPDSIKKILEDVCNILTYQANKKNIELIFNLSSLPDGLLHIDGVRLSQIFTNLLSNAIKFTPQGSVTLTASIIEQNSSSVSLEFRVTDTGIGISAEKLENIFVRYEQADAKIHTQFGGTGLGLSISKKLIEMMNGTIHVESTEGKGTTFIIKINFEFAEEIAVPLQNDLLATPFLQGKTILIADDIEENRKVLKEILNTVFDGLVIYEAADGLQVLDILKTQKFDLILMDLDMPEMNGFQTTENIRKEYTSEKLKIIATTASLLTLTKEEILNLGFNDLLLKPLKTQKLMQAISNQFN